MFMGKTIEHAPKVYKHQIESTYMTFRATEEEIVFEVLVYYGSIRSLEVSVFMTFM